jgi:hypothetical protein
MTAMALSRQPLEWRTLRRTVRLAVVQALIEQRSFWRSAEYALFTFALPLALLLLIGSTTANGDLPGTHVEGQMIFVPSIIAFGVIVAAYVNLGAKLATLRHDGVLKRIRTTPLPASAYLSASLLPCFRWCNSTDLQLPVEKSTLRLSVPGHAKTGCAGVDGSGSFTVNIGVLVSPPESLSTNFSCTDCRRVYMRGRWAHSLPPRALASLIVAMALC